MKDEEEDEEEDSLHMVYLQLYPELIAYPCLFIINLISNWYYVIEAKVRCLKVYKKPRLRKAQKYTDWSFDKP